MAPGTKKRRTKEGPDVLRSEAEKKLGSEPAGSAGTEGRAPEEIIHELRVHQIELEMQNEALRDTRNALEESRDKYLDLYEFAPVGYLTLSKDAVIGEANLTGAALLGADRHTLIKNRFRKFIAPKDIERWDRYFVSVLHSAGKQTSDLQLLKGDRSLLYARLEGVRIEREKNALNGMSPRGVSMNFSFRMRETVASLRPSVSARCSASTRSAPRSPASWSSAARNPAR